MSSFQFTSIEPQQLKQEIAATVRTELRLMLEEFKNLQPDDLLTRKEAAQFLKISLSTLNGWKKAGKIIGCGTGNRVYFRRSEVERCLQPLSMKSR